MNCSLESASCIHIDYSCFWFLLVQRILIYCTSMYCSFQVRFICTSNLFLCILLPRKIMEFIVCVRSRSTIQVLGTMPICPCSVHMFKFLLPGPRYVFGQLHVLRDHVRPALVRTEVRHQPSEFPARSGSAGSAVYSCVPSARSSNVPSFFFFFLRSQKLGLRGIEPRTSRFQKRWPYH